MPDFELSSSPLQFSPKRPAEVLTYAFDFKPVLATGEIISSGSWYIQAVRPASASITGMLIGGVTVMSGQSFQRIGGGDNGALYVVISRIITTNSNTIEENALLKVTDNPYV